MFILISSYTINLKFVVLISSVVTPERRDVFLTRWRERRICFQLKFSTFRNTRRCLTKLFKQDAILISRVQSHVLYLPQYSISYQGIDKIFLYLDIVYSL